MKKKIAWIVKSSTKTGADYMVKSFKNREDAVKFEFANRINYNNKLWIEKRCF